MCGKATEHGRRSLLAVSVALKVEVQGHDATLKACFKAGLPPKLPNIERKEKLRETVKR